VCYNEFARPGVRDIFILAMSKSCLGCIVVFAAKYVFSMNGCLERIYL
jgi:hypothetical protein